MRNSINNSKVIRKLVYILEHAFSVIPKQNVRYSLTLSFHCVLILSSKPNFGGNRSFRIRCTLIQILKQKVYLVKYLYYSMLIYKYCTIYFVWQLYVNLNGHFYLTYLSVSLSLHPFIHLSIHSPIIVSILVKYFIRMIFCTVIF